MKNRTGIDFSKHTHRVEIFKCGEKEIRVDHLQVGNSRMNYLQFVNTDDTLTVTGDFGNWVFCRPFVPSSKGYVSEGYWIEKLCMVSEQKLDKLDFEAIQKEIKELIDSGLEEYGFEGKELEDSKEWFKELLEETENGEIEYYHKAFYDYHKPDCLECDPELIPTTKKVPNWLNIVFDAFEEMCKRIKEG